MHTVSLTRSGNENDLQAIQNDRGLVAVQALLEPLFPTTLDHSDWVAAAENALVTGDINVEQIDPLTPVYKREHNPACYWIGTVCCEVTQVVLHDDPARAAIQMTVMTETDVSKP